MTKNENNIARPTLSSRGDRPTSFKLADIPMPSGKEEDWRFTPLRRMKDLLEDEISASLPEVFLPDYSSHALSVENPIKIGENSRAEIVSDSPMHGQVGAPGDRAAVVEWNNHQQLLQLTIGAGEELQKPVILSISDPDENASTQHICISAEAKSKALVILEHHGPARLNQAVEVKVAEDAELELVSIQEWDEQAVHLSNHRACLADQARFKHIVITFGGSLVRICPDVEYSGEGAEAEMLGVYFADSGQHLEHRLFVDHQTRDCKSDVNYRGALQGTKPQGVWIGDVLIGPDAFGTDSYEQNRNLVLNKGAKVDSVPNLEIENGSIAGAGHASATARFDEEQLFYLRSRGIPESEARKLVVHGFFAELINQIGIESVQERLLVAVDKELKKAQVANRLG